MCISVNAQSIADAPQMEWRSTGVMAGSGTNLPMAAQDGVTTTYDKENGSGNVKPKIRKVGRDDDIGDPGALPIGEGVLVLSILGAAYLMTRSRKRLAK